MLALALIACDRPEDGSTPPTEPPTPPRPSFVPASSIDLIGSFAGDAVIASEADLEQLEGVRSIGGDLVVDGTGLRTLSLPDLERVGGDVLVWRNDALATLALPALVSVGGDLSLYDLPLLTTLEGLGALETVGGQLAVNRDPALLDLRGLDALTSIGEDLYVFHSVGLTTLSGLRSLETVGAVKLWESYALVDATFPALHTVVERIDVFECDALTTLSFPALTALPTYELDECDAMRTLGDFPLVTAMDGAIIATFCDALAGLEGFPALAEADRLVLDHDDALVSLAGLSALTVLGDALSLTELGALATIDLPALASVDTLVVANDLALVDPGLPALTAITSTAAFSENPQLSQCAVEALVDRTTPPAVVCTGNLDDGCSAWCTP